MRARALFYYIYEEENMARHIDLTNKLDMEKPTITINGKKYEINDEKSNILSMNSLLSKSNLSEVEMFDKIIEKLLGKKALKELDNLHLGLKQYEKIALALMACVNDEELEDVESRFQDRKDK